jgi:hypothetical protein
MMGLGQRKTGGEPLPRLVWDAKGCQIYTEVRTNSGGNDWFNEQNRIELPEFRGTPDLSNIEKGWIAYVKGKGLDTKLVPVHSGKDHGDAPSDDHREGLWLIWSVDGAPYEMISTAAPLWDAIDKLDDAFLAGASEHAAQLPIVGIASTTEMTLRNGHVMYGPVFKILDWRLRPRELPAEGIPIFKPIPKKKDATKADNFGPDKPAPAKRTGTYDDEIPF